MSYTVKSYEDKDGSIEEDCVLCEGSGYYIGIGDHKEAIRKTCPCCHGKGKISMPLRKCPECGRIVSKADMTWVNDYYGNPYKHVCFDCTDKVEKEIENWRLDEGYAGEHLEEDW